MSKHYRNMNLRELNDEYRRLLSEVQELPMDDPMRSWYWAAMAVVDRYRDLIDRF
jgi:hypothetical protein